MKKALYLLVSFVCIAILFSGCDSGNSLTVKKFLPGSEVKQLTTLQFEFNKDVAPPDILNEWSDEAFITFSPQVFGKFKWVNRRTLIFSPDVPYEEMKEYTAKISEKVLFQSGLSSDFDEITFKTEDFKPLDLKVYWKSAPTDIKTVIAVAKMSFNYPVTPDEMKKNCSFTVEGKPAQVLEVVTTEAGTEMMVNLGDIPSKSGESEITATLKEGFTPAAGRGSLQENEELEAALPDISTLAINGISTYYNGSSTVIEVFTSQKVDDKLLPQFVSIAGLNQSLQFTSGDESFTIEANLNSYSQVSLIIKQGLRGNPGGVLKESFSESISLVELSPALNFADRSGKYLLLKGERNIKVNFVNIDEAEVEVRTVPATKMLPFLNNYSYEYYGSDNYNRYYYTGDDAKPILQDTIRLNNYRNWMQQSTVNLNALLPDTKKGIYVVTVLSSKDRYISDSKIVALSDLGIIAKESETGLTVFVNNLQTTDPVSGAQVKILTEAGEELYKGITLQDGTVKYIRTEISSDNIPVLITVEHNDDFNYIDLREARIETSRYEVDGRTFENKEMMTYLYMDRNIYRPGERVYFSSIVRTPQMTPVKDNPIYYKVYSPSGKVIEDLFATLNQEGSAENSFVLAGNAQVGVYTLAAFSAPEKQIASLQFNVEEFVPEKMRVLLQPDKKSVNPGGAVGIAITAEYLFGAPASGAKYSAVTQYREIAFTAKSYPEYEFGYIFSNNAAKEQQVNDGTLNEQGKTTFAIAVPQLPETPGFYQASTVVSVFDISNKPVIRGESFKYFTNTSYIGLKAGDYYISTNQRKSFSLIALSTDEKPVDNTEVEYELIHERWSNVLKKNWDGKYSYSSELTTQTIEKKSVVLPKGGATYSFIPQKWGSYILSVKKKGSAVGVKKIFYSYGGDQISSFEVSKEGEVTIIPSKTEYRTGEQAKILFTTPFDGKMLVTAEADGLLYHKYITVSNNTAELTLPITQAYVPNIYISATLFRAHNAKDKTPLFVAHGYASVKVDDPADKIPVTLSAPERIKPGTTQNITVNTGGSAFVTLALVDEGVLQIKNFNSPDPYNYYYSKRALGVTGYDMYRFLLPEYGFSDKTPGADAAFMKGLTNRLNPVSAKRYNIFAFWSGIVQTRGGSVTIPVKIPAFNGEARIMAVAYRGRKFGAASKPIKISDDVIVEQQLPRVLSAGDNGSSAVTLVNTTGKETTVSLSVTAEGNVKMIQYPQQSVTLKAGEMKSLMMSYTASGPGNAKFTATVKGGASSKEVIDIAVRPSNPWSVETGAGSIKGGNQVQISIPGGYYGSPQSKIIISRVPATLYLKELQALIEYPYGCIEQITAKAFSQLYVADIMKAVFPGEKSVKGGAGMVKDAIKQIESQQLYNGSFSYWEGGTYSNWWSSVFAVHFLLEANKAGFSVSHSVLNSALGFLQRKVKEPFAPAVITASTKSSGIKVPKEIAYSLYVLALAKRADQGTMNYIKTFLNSLSADDAALLAGAYAASGKWNTYYEVVPKQFTQEKRGRSGDDSFDSGLRGDLIKLNILLDQEPGNAQIPQLLRYLASMRGNFGTTQEQSFLFTALGKAAARFASSSLTVDVKSGNASLGKFSGATVTINKNDLAGKTVTLSAAGNGEVFYFYSTEGIKVNSSVKEEDSRLQVRREYFDMISGKKITDNVFTRGQYVVTLVSIAAGDAGAYNVAITDMLPGCLEAENTRLSAMNALNWMQKKPADAASSQFRDDRVIFFTSLGKNEVKQFYYFARVTSAGKFTLPPIAAESMYLPEVHSYHGKGTITSK